PAHPPSLPSSPTRPPPDLPPRPPVAPPTAAPSAAPGPPPAAAPIAAPAPAPSRPPPTKRCAGSYGLVQADRAKINPAEVTQDAIILITFRSFPVGSASSKRAKGRAHSYLPDVRRDRP